MQKKAIYLIQEPGCLNPCSGAFQHISMGVKHLSSSFDLEVYLKSNKLDLLSYEKNALQTQKNKTIKNSVVQGFIYGTLKDVQLFFMNLLGIKSLVKVFKRENPDFVYERASYLNFSGLIACKYLGIPHFYEANGLQYKGRRRYYRSLFGGLAKYFERQTYLMSAHIFFVGSYGDFWKIKKRNWTNVENGIEKDCLIDIKDRGNNEREIINICFLGRLMDHQKIDVFIKALEIFKNKHKIRINLIGSGLDSIESEIQNLNIQVVNHGFVDRSRVVRLLSEFDIAIISGSNSFQSCMKLFDYGAAGCAVIAPNTHNLKFWFGDELFFFNGNSDDLSNKLETLVNNENNLIYSFGEKLNLKIKGNFTWEAVFAQKVKIIKDHL